MLVYASQTTSSVTLSGAAQIATTQRVLSWSGAGGPTTIVTTDDLAVGALPVSVQHALFNGDTLVSPQVTQVAITNIFPVRSSSSDNVVLFVAFSAQIQGTLAAASTRVQSGYTLNAIINWRQKRNVFTAPCPIACTALPASTCGGVCNSGLDQALALGRQGRFTAIWGPPTTMAYLFLPTTDPLTARIVWLHPSDGLVQPLTSAQQQTYGGLSPDPDTMRFLGSWTHAQVFSFTPEASFLGKPTRDAWTHYGASSSQLLSLPNLYLFQSDQRQQAQSASMMMSGMVTLGLSGQWLSEVRLAHGSLGWQLRAFLSQQARTTAQLNLNCTYLSCAGCSTSRLRLLCSQAQDCVLSKCVGAVVQTHSVLCGLGGVLEGSAKHAIITWRAIHMTLAELALLTMRNLLLQEGAAQLQLRFPTEGFYSMLCTCKDSFAAMIGLGISLGNALTDSLNSLSGAAVDLTGSRDVGALAGEGVLKSASLGGLLFNAISSGTLLPTMALHRWLLCITNASMAGGAEGTLGARFADVALDDSWAMCANLEGLQGLLASNDFATASGNLVTEFVKFAMSLTSGLGETVLYGMQLSFTAMIDYFIGLVWSVQDVLATYNLHACKLPDYALRYVLECACNDTAVVIPQPQRGHGLTDGALWCVGTLSMVLVDGTTSVIYNPYTLDQLSAGVAGVTTYIQCISTTWDDHCPPPPAENVLLATLVQQGVEPIAVWGRCKSNYALSAWDTAAGVLFTDAAGAAGVPDAVAAQAVAWAQAVSPNLLGCLQDASRLRAGDYSDCARLYYALTRDGQSPAGYYLYAPQPATWAEPPDACQVFTGLQAAANPGSPLGNLMDACVLEENAGQTVACDLNPLVRHSSVL